MVDVKYIYVYVSVWYILLECVGFWLCGPLRW